MNKKKLILLLGVAAVLGMTGCSSKETDTAETEFSTAAPEAVAEEDIDTKEFLEEDSEVDAEELLEEDSEEETEAALAPVTPSDYLLDDTSDYVTLGDLKGLEATQYIYEITDEMIDEEIQHELEMYSEEVEVDRAAQSGDIIYVELTSTVDGGDPESESTYFVLGDEEYGAEFDEQLTGAIAGETKKFAITFGDDIWIEEWIGQTVNFKAQITSVCEMSVPEYNDDFISEYTDYTSKEDYEAALKESLTADYEDLSYSDVIDALFEEAQSKSVFAGYPEEMFQECKDELLSIYYAFVGSEDEEEIYSTFDITEETLNAEAEASVNRRVLVNAICLENDLEVTEEEYFSFLEDYAGYYGYDSAAQFEEDYSRSSLIWSMYESKAAELLYQDAKITEVAYDDEALEEEEIIEE